MYAFGCGFNESSAMPILKQILMHFLKRLTFLSPDALLFLRLFEFVSQRVLQFPSLCKTTATVTRAMVIRTEHLLQRRRIAQKFTQYPNDTKHSKDAKAD